VTTIELVRHAKAIARDRWSGRADRERPLTEDGERQAAALARELTEHGSLDAIYSSPFVRCTRTVAPLAEAVDAEIGDVEGLAEADAIAVLDGGDAWVASAWLAGRALAFLDGAVAAHDGGRIVACSHGDVIPAVMAALAGRDAFEMSDVGCRKGGRFTLTFDGGRCIDVRQHDPPPV
jgi:broad specificity phosphatase PhoE